VGGPERVGIERRVGVGDDYRDRVRDARRIPRLVGQGLELRRFVERSASVRDHQQEKGGRLEGGRPLAPRPFPKG